MDVLEMLTIILLPENRLFNTDAGCNSGHGWKYIEIL